MSGDAFSARLKDAMERRAMKQVDIIRAADKKGVKLGKSQISQYISGKTFPRDNVRRVLADILSVDADWLGGGRSGAVVEIEQTNTDIIGGKTKMREFKKSTKLDNVLYDVR